MDFRSPKTEDAFKHAAIPPRTLNEVRTELNFNSLIIHTERTIAPPDARSAPRSGGKTRSSTKSYRADIIF